MSTSSSVDSAAWGGGWLEGRSVLVTGGTGGIGGALAGCFRDAGAKVHATGATEAECEAARALETSRSIAYSALDVRSNEAVTRLIGELDDLHVVINCAGIIRRGHSSGDV